MFSHIIDATNCTYILSSIGLTKNYCDSDQFIKKKKYLTLYYYLRIRKLKPTFV